MVFQLSGTTRLSHALSSKPGAAHATSSPVRNFHVCPARSTLNSGEPVVLHGAATAGAGSTSSEDSAAINSGGDKP